MATPHDGLFKRVFGQPRHAEAELRHVLPVEVVAAADWGSLEVIPASFVDDELRERHADLLYTLRVGGRRALVYLLLEHKSTSDADTVLQLLIYLTRIWERFRAEHGRAAPLPPILPVVIHHGSRPWTASRSFAEVLDLDEPLREALRPYLVDFRYVLDDLAGQSEERLRGRTLSALVDLALFCLARSAVSADLVASLRPLAGAIRAVQEAEGGADALAGVLSYIMQTSDVPTEELRRFLELEVGPDAERTLMSTAERIANEALERGRAEGRAELLLRQLNARFGAPSAEVAARVRSASIEELDRWAERVLTADTIERVLG